MALAWHLEAKKSRFINDSDSFTTLTAPYDTYISRFSDFLWTNDNNAKNDRTDYFTPCACVRGNDKEPSNSLVTIDDVQILAL